MLLIDLVQLSADPEDLFRVDSNVGGLAKVASGRLVNHYRRVGKTISLPWVAATKQE